MNYCILNKKFLSLFHFPVNNFINLFNSNKKFFYLINVSILYST